MSARLLMPKATAVWLIENTMLTFEQIADFCGLHILEVQAIADGESAYKMKGTNPLNMGQLTRAELEKGEKDPSYRLQLQESKIHIPAPKKKVARYTPVSRRHDRPNAILWLLRYHPELTETQISRLIGTTKKTIEQIKNRSHWNSANLTAIDPVGLGLTTQIELDREVKEAQKNQVIPETGDTLLPPSTTENLPLDQNDYKKNTDITFCEDMTQSTIDSMIAKLKNNN
ncbi:DUF1013 domain-containing protein [Bartonella sp. DGB1]|uniref:DUF1013 domain-containing protein n=1 Tax=Bartonella sp. DGB1 TaxID=3239807 RepID=UPI0035235500